MKKITEIIGLIFGTMLLFIVSNYIAVKAGIYAFGWEQIIEVFVNFLKFSMALGYILLIFVIVWLPIYKFFDFSFKGAREAWEDMPKHQKLWFALALLFVLVTLYIS